MLVPNRHGSTPAYRYGFNGKEKDDELKGIGNSYDFGARMLDPRVGRWFSPDRMEEKYPSFSPYNSFANNPLFFIDPDGNDILPWKTVYDFFFFKYTSYSASLSDVYDSPVKFHKSYAQMMGSSKIFRKVIDRLENSSRTYQFKTVHNGHKLEYTGENGHFDPNRRGTKDDPFTINLVIDIANKKTHAGNKAVIFEEVFHAAQNDYALATKTNTSSLAIEVEAKLVKNIEGLTSSDQGLQYEVMNFKGSKEIFTALRGGKKLTTEQRNVLGLQIQELVREVARTYEYDENDFYAQFDLQYAEKLYGQDLTNKAPEVQVNSKKTKK